MLSLAVSRALITLNLVLLFGGLTSTTTFAATIESLLKNQSTLMATQQANLEILESRLMSYEESKVEARDRLEKALSNVVDARIHLENASSNQGARSTTQRELAQRSLALAEQGFEGRQGRLNRIEKKLAKIQSSISERRINIERQRRVVEQLHQQYSYQKAQRQRQQTYAALVPDYDEAFAPVAAKGDIEVMTSAALAADIARLPPPAAGSSVSVVHHQEMHNARAEMRRLHEITSAADKKFSGRYQALQLVLDRQNSIDLEYWGQGQYYAEVPLSAGTHHLQIKHRSFRVDVSDAKNNDTYVIIYDASPKGRPRLLCFNENLLKNSIQ